MLPLQNPSRITFRTFQELKHLVARLKQRIIPDGGWMLRKILLCHKISLSLTISPLSVVVFLKGSSTRWHGPSMNWRAVNGLGRRHSPGLCRRGFALHAVTFSEV